MYATAATTTRESKINIIVVLSTILSSSIRRDNFAAVQSICSKYAVVAIPPHDTSISWKNELYAVLGSYLVPGKFPQLACTSLWSLIWCISPYSTVVPVETPFTQICL